MYRLLVAALIGILGLGLGAPDARAQKKPTVPIARVKYDGGGDWYSDEKSLTELFAFARQHTLLRVPRKEDVVELKTDKVFAYPYLYLTGHGNITLSASEADRLRRYLLQGGFLHVDDNYGLAKHIRPELKKVFPEKKLVEVPFDHPIYHIRYDFPNGLPAIHKHDPEEAPKGYGIFDDSGRLMVFFSVESDLGDGWEPASVHNNPPEKRRKALRMGTNLLTYAMTH
ncbi:MAG: DUF4159 domain-containing protein [Salinibacter sp.]|uniref:DUF4159 domain-containing protein n=1 Tax=Salinibacter sp. TaxID=2065818 RepID=UPI0035D3E04D